MIIAAFVEGIKKREKKKKNPTGCYTGLAFMKKDIDVNDCESPPLPPYTHTTTTNTTTPQKKERKKEKLRHPLNFQNGRYKLPVFMQNILLRFMFLFLF